MCANRLIIPYSTRLDTALIRRINMCVKSIAAQVMDRCNRWCRHRWVRRPPQSHRHRRKCRVPATRALWANRSAIPVHWARVHASIARHLWSTRRKCLRTMHPIIRLVIQNACRQLRLLPPPLQLVAVQRAMNVPPVTVRCPCRQVSK